MSSITACDELSKQLGDLKLNLKSDEVLAYLDIDIDDSTKRYQNCVDFVRQEKGSLLSYVVDSRMRRRRLTDKEYSCTTSNVGFV